MLLRCITFKTNVNNLSKTQVRYITVIKVSKATEIYLPLKF